MVRTNIVIDETLLKKAKRLTGIKTMRNIVDHALRDLVRHYRQREILKLKGHISWEGNLSEMRRGRRAA